MLATLLASAALAAAPFPQTIPLPAGCSPRDRDGKGTTFYAGSRVNGSVYRGNLRTGKGASSSRVRTGRQALRPEGARRQALRRRRADRLRLRLRRAHAAANVDAVDFDGGFINDVTVTRQAAYFTDSLKPLIYVYDRAAGEPSTAAARAATSSTRPGSTPTASPRRRTASG